MTELDQYNWPWVRDYILLNASVILAFGMVLILLMAGAIWRPEWARRVLKVALALVTVVLLLVVLVVALDFFAII